MGLLEELGERTIGLFNRFLYYLLGILVAAARSAERTLGRLSFLSPYPLLERRGIERGDYEVLKAQGATLAFLIVAVLFIFNFLAGRAFLVLGALGGLASLGQTLSLKKYFREFDPYRDFFFSYIGITVLLVVLKIIKPTINFVFPYLHLVAISLVYTAAFSYFFKKKYARDYTLGRVLEDGDPMKIQVNYDICAGVKPGVLTIKNELGAKKGNIVKLKVEKSFLNLRGNKVGAALGLTG